MPTNLPAPTVIGPEGLDANKVQANFEALSRLATNVSSSGVIALPPGLIFPFGGATAPTGYLFCQGQSLSTSQYSALFAAIGYSYGGSGASFNIPDLQGRAPVGKGTHADVNALNKSEGQATVANRTPNHSHSVPAHYHSVTASGTSGAFNSSHQHVGGAGGWLLASGTGGAGGANVSTGGGGYILDAADPRLGNHTHSLSVSGTAGSNTNASGDSAFTSGASVGPFLVINYIIKT